MVVLGMMVVDRLVVELVQALGMDEDMVEELDLESRIDRHYHPSFINVSANSYMIVVLEQVLQIVVVVVQLAFVGMVASMVHRQLVMNASYPLVELDHLDETKLL